MKNKSIKKSINNLDGGASHDLNTRLDLLTKQQKVISNEKARKICILMHVMSSNFAIGAVKLSEQGILSSLEKGSISEENAELSRILLRQMFSARDGESSKGKQNYVLLQNLIKVIFHPNSDYNGDFLALLIKESKKYPLFEALGKEIKSSFDSRKRGAVACAVIEYYTPMLIKLLTYVYEFGLSEKQNRIKFVNKNKAATLYLENHNHLQTTHLGFHTYRTMLRESEYDIFEYHASQILVPFVSVIRDIEQTLLIKTEIGKF